MAPPRVAFVGLDGMEPTLTERMLEAGELPSLARLRSRGLWCGLEDREDFRSGLVWEHMLLGRGTAAVGRFSGVEFDATRYETWQVGSGTQRPFYATDPPLRCVVFDVPYSHPAHRVPGVVVTAWGGHDAGYPRASEPPGLLTEIDRRFGHHRAFDNDHVNVWHRPDDAERLVEALLEGAGRRAEAVAWLLGKTPGWELLLTVLSEPHSAGEQLWHGVDPRHPLAGIPTAPAAGERVREVYRATDAALGRIVAALPSDAHVVVASLHGMTTNYADVASMALLPELLHRRETGRPLLRNPADAASWRARGCPPVVLGPGDRWTRHLAAMRVRDPLLRRAGAWLTRKWARLVRRRKPRREPALPGALGVPIPFETRRTPEEVGTQRTGTAWHPCTWYRGAWPRMRAFAVPTFYDGRIRVNLEGREACGRVRREDYAATLDGLESWAGRLRDVRTGRPAVAEIHRFRDEDPFAPGGCDSDLVLVWAAPSDALEHPETGMVGPYPFRRTGGHTPDGFLAVAGPGVLPARVGPRSARDVTPTILALLGRPAPPETEGTAVAEAVPGFAGAT
jgi:predicted AlkP superfamily phosphohydrolase/phosphomutase